MWNKIHFNYYENEIFIKIVFYRSTAKLQEHLCMFFVGHDGKKTFFRPHHHHHRWMNECVSVCVFVHNIKKEKQNVTYQRNYQAHNIYRNSTMNWQVKNNVAFSSTCYPFRVVHAFASVAFTVVRLPVERLQQHIVCAFLVSETQLLLAAEYFPFGCALASWTKSLIADWICTFVLALR